jgi:hypothetical protein
MNLNKTKFISQKLDSLKDKLISKDNIVRVIELFDNKTPLKKLENLRKSKKIKYIFLNYYYILSENERKYKILNYTSEELVISILNKLKIKWHYSIYTALERNNVVWQAYNVIVILNNSISKRVIINKTKFHFIKTQKKYLFDSTIVKTRNRISAYYPSNEKLLIDFIYFNKKVPIELRKIIKKTHLNNIMEVYPKTIQNKIVNGLK